MNMASHTHSYAWIALHEMFSMREDLYNRFQFPRRFYMTKYGVFRRWRYWKIPGFCRSGPLLARVMPYMATNIAITHCNKYVAMQH